MLIFIIGTRLKWGEKNLHHRIKGALQESFTKLSKPRTTRSHIHQRRQLLVDHIELMLVTKQAPDDRDVLYQDVDGDRAQRAQYAQREPNHAEPIERERFDDAEHVHVDVDGADEGTYEVDQGRTRDGTEAG